MMLSCLGMSPPRPMGEQGATDSSDSYILPTGQDLSIFKPRDHLPPPILKAREGVQRCHV